MPPISAGQARLGPPDLRSGILLGFTVPRSIQLACCEMSTRSSHFVTLTLSHFIGFHNFRSTQPTLSYSLVVAGCSLERLSN